MVSVPDTRPSAVGENTTLIVHEAPAAKVVVQVPPAAGREKTGDENANAIPVVVAPPELVSVRVLSPLVVVSGTLPNASGPPVTKVDPAGGAPNSTAPTSTALFAFLELLKKSVLGAAAYVVDELVGVM